MIIEILIIGDLFFVICILKDVSCYFIIGKMIVLNLVDRLLWVCE